MDLVVRFPDGAVFLTVNGETEMQFSRASVDFDEGSPFRLAAPAEISDAPGVGFRAASGGSKLSTKGLSYGSLMNALKREPADGITLLAFDSFKIKWRNGAIDEGGITNAEFQLVDIPLPGWSDARADLQFDLSENPALRLKFFGEFALPVATNFLPKVTIREQAPLRLRLNPDDGLLTEVPADITWNNGSRLRGYARLNPEGFYVAVDNPGERLSAASNLVTRIPTGADRCLPANPTPPQQILAEQCLTNLAAAYARFNALVSSMMTSPPPPFDEIDETVHRSSDSVDLYLDFAVAGANPPLSASLMTNHVSVLAEQGAAAAELSDILERRLAVMRLRAEIQHGRITAITLEKAVVDRALGLLEAAAVDRLQQAHALPSLESLRRMSEFLQLTETARREAQLPEGTFVPLFLEECVQTVRRMSDEMAVEPGVWVSAPDSPIRDLKTPKLRSHLAHLVGLAASLRSLGLVITTARFDELRVQLAAHHRDGVERALSKAEQQFALSRFVEAGTRYIELSRWAQQGLLPSADPIAALFNTFSLQTLGNRLDSLAALSQLRLLGPQRRREPKRSLADIKDLLPLFRSIPNLVPLTDAAFRPSFDVIEQALINKVTAAKLGLVTKIKTISELLEMGFPHREYGARLGFASAASWETVRLPMLIDRLVALSTGETNVNYLQKTAQLLINASRLAGSKGDVAGRTACLTQLARVLQVLPAVSNQRYQKAIAEFPLQDINLPGDLRVRQPAGYVRYQTKRQEFRGALRGELLIPGWALSLALDNASFSGDGSLDLTAHGSIGLPAGTLSIPARQPLRIQNVPGRPLQVSGTGRMTLDNGLEFDASVSLADPRYCFGLEARGLDLDLGRQLLAPRPGVSSNAVAAYTEVTRDAVADYFGSLSASLESVLHATRSTELPALVRTIRPPEFIAPEVPMPLAPLNAWISRVAAGAASGLGSATVSIDVLLSALNNLKRMTEIAPGTTAEELSRLEVLTATAADLHTLARHYDRAAVSQALGAVGQQRLETAARELLLGLQQKVLQLITPDLPDRPADASAVSTALAALLAAQHDLEDSSPASAQLPAAPCEAMLASSSSVLTRALGLAVCTYNRRLAALGLDPSTGLVADSARLNGLSPEELAAAAGALSELKANFDAMKAPTPPHFVEAAGVILSRQRTLLHLTLAGSTDLADQVEIGLKLADHLLDVVGTGLPRSNTDYQPGFDFLVRRLATVSSADLDRANQIAADRMEGYRRMVDSRIRSSARRRADQPEHRSRSLLGALEGYARSLGLVVPVDAGPGLDAYLRSKAGEHRARRFVPELLTQHLDQAGGLAEDLAALTSWATRRLASDSSLMVSLGLTWADLTASVASAAEPQRAWWILKTHDNVLRDSLAVSGAQFPAVLKNSLLIARTATLLASQRVVNGIADVFSRVHAEDVVLRLPGEIDLKTIYGRLCYERVLGELSGCFGGRVEFTGVNSNLFFDVTSACLTTSGAFSIEAAMGTPIPFGEASLKANVTLAGTPSGLSSVRGGGTLTLPNGTLGARAFSVNLSYVPGERRMSFDTMASNLDLRFADDFVLFEAGFGFDLTPGVLEGSFRTTGSAGLFARRHPLPAVVTTNDFHLSIARLQTRFSYLQNTFSVVLSNGTLHLPDIFKAGACPVPPGQPDTGPRVSLVPTNPIVVTVTPEPQQVTFSGALDFRNIFLGVPGNTNLQLGICSSRLVFGGNTLPCLKELNATLSVGLPNGPAVVNVNGTDWCVDGFPVQSSIRLIQPLRLVSAGGFTLDVQTNSGFSITRTDVGGPTLKTVFRLEGGMLGKFDSSVLFDDATQAGFGFGTRGFLQLTYQEPPAFGLDSLTFQGRFRLGGSSGFALIGVDANGIPDTNTSAMASITLTGISNLVALAPDRTFEVHVSGALGAAEFIYFGLGDARLIFDGINTAASPEPQFLVTSIGYREGENIQMLPNLPLRLTSGSITFLQPGLPLSRLLSPDNIVLTFGGVVDISLAPPDANNSELPRLYGEVNNVQVRFPQGFAGPPQFSVNAFVLLLENLKIGDMAGLTGGLTVGNLNHPEDLYFAGTVGGDYNGVGIRAILAAKLTGLLGLCLSANAGPAGIPLDGGTLGGILLTGAKGGVSFLNQFADPCEFKSYLGLTDEGKPAGSGGGLFAPAAVRMTSPAPAPDSSWPRVGSLPVLSWQELAVHQSLHEQSRTLRSSGTMTALSKPSGAGDFRAAGSPGAGGLPCPTGDCPPATLNLLCQRHPSAGETPSSRNYDGRYQDRVIFKFTSLSRDSVDDILQTAGIQLGNQTTATVANNFADALKNLVAGLVPPVPSTLPPAEQQRLTQFIANSLAAMRNLVADTVRTGLEAATGGEASLREALYEAAYAGVRCTDLTIQLKGTFSYAPVSFALSAEGGAVASTTGSAGILGALKLFGLPIGTAEFFLSLTDTNGNPNPSLCGGAHVALGPLELGQMGLAIGCDECVTGTLTALAQYVQALTGDLGDAARPILYTLIEQAAGDRLTAIRSRPLSAYFGIPGPDVLLTQAEQVAILTTLLNLSELTSFLNANPQVVSQFSREALNALSQRTLQLVLAIYNSTNPRLQFCGEVEPKLFGFSLTGGNTLVAAQVYADKTRIGAGLKFSPSYILGNLPFFLASGGRISSVVPALDEAQLGMGLGLPSVNEATLQQLRSNPAAFASTQVNHLLANAILTFGYEFNPFGFKLADGEGRIILPTLDDHPENPARRAARPEDYDAEGRFRAPTSPDRARVLAAALQTELLADPTWNGRNGTLARIFPNDSTAAANVANRELARDYFPHGGFLGAGRIGFPNVIVGAPPFAKLAELFKPLSVTNLIDRLGVAQDVITNYVLASTDIGSLTIYMPFPNPPNAFWSATQGPQAFLNSLASATPATLIAGDRGLFPIEQLFMRGDANLSLLGIPLGNAEIVADPGLGLFRLTAGVPAESWLHQFVQGSLTAEVRTAEYILQSNPNQLPPGISAADLTPEARFQWVVQTLRAASRPSASNAEREQAVINAVNRITDTLPKVSVDLAAGVSLPRSLTNIVQSSGALRFIAYSPRFNPNFPGVGAVAEVTRNGGLALAGRFNFANYVTADGALGVALRPGLPALLGEFDVPQLNLVGIPVNNFHFAFNSDPAPNGAFLDSSSTLSPLVFRNPLDGSVLLSISNLVNLALPLSNRFTLRKDANGNPAPELLISPARVHMPMLGGVFARIHGATTNDPFTFSGTGSWTSTVTVGGQLSLRNPVDGTEIMRVDAAGQEFRATLRGTGFSIDEFLMDLPDTNRVTAFPGTPNAYTIALDSRGASNQLLIRGDGTFQLDGGLGGNLGLPGLGFGSINAGARFRISNSGLSITVDGKLSGGALASMPAGSLASIVGTFAVGTGGVSLTGTATLNPVNLPPPNGVFRLSGLNRTPIVVQLTRDGLSIPNGAVLGIVAPSYPDQDLLTLNEFVIAGNGNFRVAASNSAFRIPGYLAITQGSFLFQRSNNVVWLDVQGPALTFFPGTPQASSLAPLPQTLVVSSSGTFYLNTGQRMVPLPGGFSAHGQLEIGYLADPRLPGIGVTPTSLAFGTINYGSSTTRTLRLTNSGDGPLSASLSLLTNDGPFSITPNSVQLDGHEFQDVTVRFTPAAAGAFANSIRILHNASSPAITVPLTATSRAVPILTLSTTNIVFGDVTLSNRSMRFIRVSNLGVTNLLATNRVLSGPFTAAPVTLNIPPGSNALVQVTFAPTVIGSASTTLQFTGNDGSAIRPVGLAGSGVLTRWYDQRDGSERLTTIAMGSDRGFVHGSPRTLLYTENRGHSWAPSVQPPPAGNYLGCLASDGLTGWLAGSGTALYKTLDAGKTWQYAGHTDLSSAPGDFPTFWSAAVEQTGTRKVMLVGSRLEWVNQPPLGQILQLRSVTATETAAGFNVRSIPADPWCAAWATVGGSPVALVAGQGKVQISIDSGGTWSAATISPALKGSIRGIGMSSSGVGLFATTKGEVYRSANSGQSWGSVLVMTNRAWNAVTADGLNVTIVGEQGRILRSSDGGLNWSEEVGGANPLLSVAARSGRTWASGNAGDILHRPASLTSSGILTVEPANLGFGIVTRGDSEPRALWLRNRGVVPLVVTNIVATNVLASEVAFSTGFPLTIPPNGSVPVNVYFNPTTTNGLNGRLLISSGDADGLLSVGLSGRSISEAWLIKPPLPGSTGQSARDLQLTSANIGYAITASGAFKTTNGGVSWFPLAVPFGGSLQCVHFVSDTTGWIGGGGGVSLFILKTTDGGSTWTTQLNTSGTGITDIHMVSSLTGFAVSYQTIFVQPKLYATTNGGATWLQKTVPGGSIADRGLHATSATEVFLAAGRELFRSLDGGGTWSSILTNGPNNIRQIDFVGTTFGWVVGDNGSVWRTTLGGDAPSEWTSVPAFTTQHLARVHFASSTIGWAVPLASSSPGAIFGSRDGGLTWREELADSPSPGPSSVKATVVFGNSASNAVAIGSDGAVRRLESVSTAVRGLPVAQPVLEFAPAEVGASVTNRLAIRNAGNRNLNLIGATVESGTGSAATFEVITLPSTPLASGQTQEVTVAVHYDVPGPVRSTLRLNYSGGPNGTNDVIAVQLSGHAIETPQVVNVLTEPPGLSVIINGASVTAPRSYTVVEAAADPSEWTLGTTQRIEAVESIVVNGQRFAFVDWVPFAERAFDFVTTNGLATVTARYVAVPSDNTGIPQGGGGLQAASGGSLPPGLPNGPFLRVTQATLSNAAVGDFRVSGSLLLSADNIVAALTNRAIRLPANPQLPALAEVSAGSWRFELTPAALQLVANSPGLTVLSNRVSPPSEIAVGFDRLKTNFAATLVLPRGLPLAPGLIELGSNTAISLTYTSRFGLGATGEVRAFRTPDNKDWAFKKALNFRVEDGPFQFPISLTDSVVRVTVPGTAQEFFEMRGNPGNMVFSRSAGGVLGFALNNIGLEFLGRRVATVSGAVNSSGLIRLNATNSGDTFPVGPLQWHSVGTSSFEWNIANGVLKLNLPGGTLKDDDGNVPGWPANGWSFPPLSFNSAGDFDLVLTMTNVFHFNGIPLGLSPSDDDRFIQIKRKNGRFTLRLQDEQDFFDGSARISLSAVADPSGRASAVGEAVARTIVDFGIVKQDFGTVTLKYDSARPDYQFRFSGGGFSLGLGSGGIQACQDVPCLFGGDCNPVCIP